MTAPTLPLTESEVDSDFLTDIETAFEKKCQAGEHDESLPDCEHPATWIMQSRHTNYGCPGPEVFFCDDHAQFALNWWKNVLLHKPPPQCPHCKTILAGQVSKFLYAIKL